ncbi:diphthine synthase [Candidatus Woesearchaeota archaeon]|nr:diphthine synthase [Candidatus Woesearchaeota archaeon]
MVLYLIGLGLENEKDITLKGLERIKESKEVYFENYTSKLQCSVKDLGKLYKRKIIIADRNFIEEKSKGIIKKAKKESISILIPGDVFSATTHIALFQEAKKYKVPVEVFNNASILTAIGITGLELYKFGRVASIPFDNEKIKTPIEILNENQKINLHTLFLLDLNNETKKYLSIQEAIEYLLKNKIKKETMAVACARIGWSDYKIKSGTLEELMKINYGDPPYCLVIPAKKLHFIEEEMIAMWNNKA